MSDPTDDECIRLDRQYAHGFFAGWNAGVVGDQQQLKGMDNRLRIPDHVRNQRNLAEEYKKALEIAREALEIAGDFLTSHWDMESAPLNKIGEAIRQIDEVMK